jgi:hypothetical protein
VWAKGEKRGKGHLSKPISESDTILVGCSGFFIFWPHSSMKDRIRGKRGIGRQWITSRKKERKKEREGSDMGPPRLLLLVPELVYGRRDLPPSCSGARKRFNKQTQQYFQDAVLWLAALCAMPHYNSIHVCCSLSRTYGSFRAELLFF